MSDTDDPQAQDLEETPAAGGPANPATDAAATELEQLRAERDDYKSRLTRAQADYQNSRKRLESEFQSTLNYASGDLIKSLLPVIDNFERAALAVDPAKVDAASILKGLQAVHDQWLAVLKAQNVQVIAPEPGTPFDPHVHEALLEQPSKDYDEPTVTQLFQKGYSLNGRRLRPASVAVSKRA